MSFSNCPDEIIVHILKYIFDHDMKLILLGKQKNFSNFYNFIQTEKRMALIGQDQQLHQYFKQGMLPRLHRLMPELLDEIELTTAHKYFLGYQAWSADTYSFKDEWPNAEIMTVTQPYRTAYLYVDTVTELHSMKVFFKQSPDNVNYRLVDNNTLLHRACRTRDLPLLKVLLQYKDIDLNAKTDSGTTAVYFCCESGFSVGLKLLLQHDEVDVNQAPRYCRSPLGLVSYGTFYYTYPREALLNLLFSRKDLNVNIIYNDNYTIMQHEFSFWKGISMIERLLSHSDVMIEKFVERYKELEEEAQIDIICSIMGKLKDHPAYPKLAQLTEHEHHNYKKIQSAMFDIGLGRADDSNQISYLVQLANGSEIEKKSIKRVHTFFSTSRDREMRAIAGQVTSAMGVTYNSS